MSNVIEKAEQYHNQFQKAKTGDERRVLASDYKAYYAQLSAEDKAEADKVHDAHFAKTQQKIDAMEPVLQQVKEMLRQHYQQTT